MYAPEDHMKKKSKLASKSIVIMEKCSYIFVPVMYL